MNTYRSEIKFVCYQHNYFLIKNWIKLHKLNFFKEYEDRNVNNIYFDSFNYKAFNDNLSGLPSRLKIRYRWYGNLFSENKENEGSLEFKFRKSIQNKKKTPMNFRKNSVNKSKKKIILKNNLKNE